MHIKSKVSTGYTHRTYKTAGSETPVTNENSTRTNGKAPEAHAKKLAWEEFERSRVKKTASQLHVVGPETATARAAEKAFKDQFGRLASDKEKFNALMKEVYGGGYDAKAAEEFRQRALQNDYTWLPRIEFKTESMLGGGNGAFDGSRNVVYINEKFLSDPARAAKVYAEEVGHFLDTRLNKCDTTGDEGEYFRKLLAGEKLSNAEKAAIRADNDHGLIYVNGKATHVEFSIFDDIGKAVKKVGGAIVDGAKAVGNAVADGAKAVGNAVAGGVKAVGNAVGTAAKAVGKAVSSGVSAVANGVKKVAGSVWSGIKTVGNKIADAAKWIAPRIWDGLTGLATGAWNTAVGVVRNIGEGFETFGRGLGKIFKGDFAGGFGDLGSGLLKVFVQTPVDAVLLMGGRGISAIQTLIGLEPVGRKLTDAEIAELRKVYGNSIDYSQVRVKEGDAGLFGLFNRAFTHGNTIYIPKDKSPVKTELLIHEMGHVWQHQNGGTDYMSEALWAQNFGDGYEWKKGVADGKSWSELNPEQQAELLEDAAKAGFFDAPGKTFKVDGTDYTAYLNEALKQVRKGQGAA